MRNKQKKWRRGHGIDYIDEQTGEVKHYSNRQVKMMMYELNDKAAPSNLFTTLMNQGSVDEAGNQYVAKQIKQQDKQD